MRILWVKAGKLLPVNTGGRIRSYHIMRHLAAGNELSFLSYYPGDRDEEYEREVTASFPGAVSFRAGPSAGTTAQIVHYATRFAAPAPYAVAKFTDSMVGRAIGRIIEERQPEVAVCDFLSASLNFAYPLPLPSVLFQHNVESALWDRQSRHERNPAKRLLFSVEAAKMRRYERRTVARFDRVVAVSKNDQLAMSTMIDPSRITVVPTGVDLSAYRTDAREVSDDRTVMFLGSMDWPANIDGVEYFCERIWPRVLTKVPNALFQVVGRNPPERIRNLSSDSITIVGGVDSVIPHLRAASVFVVPLRIGGGTRLKIYEAMAAERAVVSTTIGAEGLEYRQGMDMLVADDATSFADAVVRLLIDRGARESLGRRAGQTAARFDWSAVADAFEDVLRDAVRSHHPTTFRAAIG